MTDLKGTACSEAQDETESGVVTEWQELLGVEERQVGPSCGLLVCLRKSEAQEWLWVCDAGSSLPSFSGLRVFSLCLDLNFWPKMGWKKLHQEPTSVVEAITRGQWDLLVNGI